MRVGIVGDIHLPFTHPKYLRFCQDTFNAWGVRKVHFIGDIVDNHAISASWDHDPNGFSARDEYEAAKKELAKWLKVFPRATVSIGNHDARHFRTANKVGINNDFLKGYREVWGTPKWDWAYSHAYDGVLYEHGSGTSGKDAAINRAIQKRRSLVMGHVHTYAGVKWHTNEFSRIFGMNVGCGIDIDAYAFAYGKDFPVRPVLGCGVVVDEVGYFIPMACGDGERYARHLRSKQRRRR